MFTQKPSSCKRIVLFDWYSFYPFGEVVYARIDVMKTINLNTSLHFEKVRVVHEVHISQYLVSFFVSGNCTK